MHEAVRHDGDTELERSVSALASSGLAAGLSMGFSFIAEGLLRSHLPDAPWRPMIVKIGYSFGSLIVIIGRQQLFTENILTAVLPALARRSWVLGHIRHRPACAGTLSRRLQGTRWQSRPPRRPDDARSRHPPGGFTHIIAGSIEALFLVMTGAVPWPTYLTGYILLTLAGNTAGRVSLRGAA
jgi:formate/nitrite transporter FocA (FNT family)